MSEKDFLEELKDIRLMLWHNLQETEKTLRQVRDLIEELEEKLEKKD